jgi:hypothetical protein
MTNEKILDTPIELMSLTTEIPLGDLLPPDKKFSEGTLTPYQGLTAAGAAALVG